MQNWAENVEGGAQMFQPLDNLVSWNNENLIYGHFIVANLFFFFSFSFILHHHHFSGTGDKTEVL